MEAETLESHVRFFVRRKWTFLRVEELEGRWPESGIVLTFDDAYLSAMTHGLDVLLKYRVAATYYAVPAYVGGTSAWDGERARPLAGWDLIRQAHGEGFEIGNHTMGHPDLSFLSAELQTREWSQAAEALESYGMHARSACYPYGKVGATSHDALRRAGYALGVGLAKRPAKPSDNPIELPRIVVAYSDRLPKLLYKLYLRPHLP